MNSQFPKERKEKFNVYLSSTKFSLQFKCMQKSQMKRSRRTEIIKRDLHALSNVFTPSLNQQSANPTFEE